MDWVEVSQSSEKIFLVLMTSIIFAVVGVVGYATFRRFKVDVAYGAFLCHHKEGAASLARYVKIRFENCSCSPVFLDSDQLEDLDLIFDIVRTKTRNLVILSTKMTLFRPWCAGEIATATVNGIRIVQVACDDYVPPDAAALAQLGSLWSEQQQFLLGQYGIDLALIEDAYCCLVALITIPLRRFELEEQQAETIDLVASPCRLPL